MRIDGGALPIGPQNTGPLDPKADALLRATQAEPPLKPMDSSNQSKDLADSTNDQDTFEPSLQAQALMAQAPQGDESEAAPVRPEAVERARQILQTGTYNDLGSLEKTADKILQELSRPV